MLLKAEMVKTPSTLRLINAWTRLYTPNFSALPLAQTPSVYAELAVANSSAGRAATAARLSQHIVELRCEIASVQTSALYTCLENVMDLNEVRQLAEVSCQVYQLLANLYQQELLGTTWFSQSRSSTGYSSNPYLQFQEDTSDIEQLANALEPILLTLQQKHIHSKDWRTIGFITTQLNFCNQWIIDKLTPVERVLLSPYLRFIEEHIAHPWQRVCTAAAQYPINSPFLDIVEQIILNCEDVAQSAYTSLSQLLPYHRSCRGLLSNPGVMHSCIRDFKMFQAYLCLSALEESLVSIEQELLSLCVMVLPSVGVKWEMTEIWTVVLADELLRRFEPFQREYLLPYTGGIHQTFLNARSQLDIPYTYQSAK